VRTAAVSRVDLEIKKAISDEELVSLYNRARALCVCGYSRTFRAGAARGDGLRDTCGRCKGGRGSESVLHTETGILTPRDEGAFAEAAADLLTNDERREAMGHCGVEVIRSFWTLRHAGERLEAHLTRAVAGAKGARVGCDYSK
jgi:glycosyltransferase involved in cell wall biosynthesis